MALVTTTEMFKKAYEGGYAIGAFNINNMETVQARVDACQEEKSPGIFTGILGNPPVRQRQLPCSYG